jgi:hypothetical protein
MNFASLDPLPHADPLHGHLQHEILPQQGVSPHSPDLRAFQSACSRNVALYEEKHGGVQRIGKFSPAHHDPLDQALFAGNGMFRDVFGARQHALKTISFSSNQGRRRRRWS